MKTFETIPLDDPIWSKLYSAYGIEDVAGPLKRLNESWDTAVAQDLFWEKLHHQDTLYPATFAAMPWLWNIAAKFPEARLEYAEFLSWCIHCALREQTGEELQGLSLDVDEHQYSWIPESNRLTSSNQERLRDIHETARGIFHEQEAFLFETAKVNASNAADVLIGVPSLRDAPAVSGLLDGTDDQYHLACPDCGSMNVVKWNGLEFVVIAKSDGEFGTYALAGRERAVAKELAVAVQDFHPALADVLNGFSRWSCCKPDALPVYDPENASGDLFD